MGKVSVDYKKNDQTILTIVIGLLIIHFYSSNQYLLYSSIIIGLCGLISKKIANYINWLWMHLAWLLSLFIPKILLSVIFYLFLFPIALSSRILSKKDPLKIRAKYDSTFVERNKIYAKEDFENPW